MFEQFVNVGYGSEISPTEKPLVPKNKRLFTKLRRITTLHIVCTVKECYSAYTIQLIASILYHEDQVKSKFGKILFLPIAFSKGKKNKMLIYSIYFL
ncbi:hypothetical protein ACF5W4_08225 [Bacillota bacterium Lsc_1132]